MERVPAFRDEDFYECERNLRRGSRAPPQLRAAKPKGRGCGVFGSNGFPQIHQYWARLKDKYYRPRTGYTPYVVVHWSLSLDKENFTPVEALHARHPKFAERVVFVSPDGPNVNARAQAKIASTDLRLANLVALPYTVGITPPAPGQGMSASAGRYNASRERPWSLLFEGSVNNAKGSRPTRAWIAAAMLEVTAGLHAQRNPRAAFPPDAAQVEFKSGRRATTYFRSVHGRALNAQLCLEPGGDAPTRSHTCIAILCGCVPVIFDHEASGHGNTSSSMRETTHFDGRLPTAWPWRDVHGNKGPTSLDYADFAVVVDVRPIARGETTMAAVLRGVAATPVADPARFLSLRRGLDRAARWMAFGLADCTAQDSAAGSAPPCDAFSALAAWLEHRTAHA